MPSAAENGRNFKPHKIMGFSFDNLNYNSVENVPVFEARDAFTVNSATVFKEDVDIVPTIIDETLSYVLWGGDNLLPFNIIDLIKKDETLSTCQLFNAEVCYGSGLRFDTCLASLSVCDEIEDFIGPFTMHKHNSIANLGNFSSGA